MFFVDFCLILHRTITKLKQKEILNAGGKETPPLERYPCQSWELWFPVNNKIQWIYIYQDSRDSSHIIHLGLTSYISSDIILLRMLIVSLNSLLRHSDKVCFLPSRTWIIFMRKWINKIRGLASLYQAHVRMNQWDMGRTSLGQCLTHSKMDATSPYHAER